MPIMLGVSLSLVGGGAAVAPSDGSATVTFAITEAQDTASVAVNTELSASLAATEAQDVAAFAASTDISASLAATEDQDTASFASNTELSASLAATEAQDTASVSANTELSASLAATEAQDTASFAAEAVSSSQGFNPSDKAADVTLSESNFAIQSASGSSGARSVTSHGTGKYYFELERQGSNGNFGVCTSSNDLDTWGGNTTHAICYDASNGDILYNGGSIASSGLGSLGNGDILNVAVDLDGETITFGKNNSYASPTSFSAYTNLASNALYAFGTPWNTATWRLRTGTGQFTYSLPSGYSAWG